MSLRTRTLLCFTALLLLASVPGSAQRTAPDAWKRIGARSAIESELLRSTARDSSASKPAHVGMWGFVTGAVIGGGAGYYAGRSLCDGVPRGNCVRNSTIGGVVIGSAIGYGIERLFRWQ